MPKSTNIFGSRPELDVDNKQVLMRIINKETEEVVEEQGFALERIHASLRPNVTLYGLSKLLSDRTSDFPVGPGKVERCEEVMAQLEAGVWQKERKAGAPTVSAEVEALAELKQCSVAEAQASLRAYSKDQRSKILGHPKIVEMAAKLRANRGEIDVSEFLSDAHSPLQTPTE